MIHFLRYSRIRQRPEPVQDSTPPWVPNSRPLPGPDSSWTEPGRCRGRDTHLAKEMNLYELTEAKRRPGRIGGERDFMSDPAVVPWREVIVARDAAGMNGADRTMLRGASLIDDAE
jgi:hypothetical protein